MSTAQPAPPPADARPPPPRASRITLDHIGAGIALVALAATILLYFLQRADALDLQRKQNTMAMLQIRYSEDMFKAKVRVGNYIKAQGDLYQQAFEMKENGKTFNAEVPTDVLDDFLTLTEFYDSVAICREQRSCDRAMVDQLFNDDMCSFAGNAVLIGLPQLEPVYGKGLGKTLLAYRKSECGQN